MWSEGENKGEHLAWGYLHRKKINIISNICLEHSLSLLFYTQSHLPTARFSAEVSECVSVYGAQLPQDPSCLKSLKKRKHGSNDDDDACGDYDFADEDIDLTLRIITILIIAVIVGIIMWWWLWRWWWMSCGWKQFRKYCEFYAEMVAGPFAMGASKRSDLQ